MKTTLLTQRFSELAEQSKKVEGTKRHFDGGFGSGLTVDEHTLLNWSVKVRNLLAMACGTESEHYRLFLTHEEPKSLQTLHERFKLLDAVFLAAKEDYEGGYLNSVRSLIQAEVFDTELEQAKELLRGNYFTAAAVIAGVVLETTLRQLCIDQGIQVGKLDKMNADLAKVGYYNTLVQKRITALAGIRNSAAHGKSGEFNADDVSGMINEVERFVSENL